MFLLIVPIIALVGCSFVTAALTSLRNIGRIRSKRLFNSHQGMFFLYPLLQKLHKRFEWEDLFFVLNFAKNILLLLFAITTCLYLLKNVFSLEFNDLLLSIIITMSIVLFFDASMRVISQTWPKATVKTTFFPAALYCVIFLPITSTLLFLSKAFLPSNKSKEQESAPKMAKDKIMELVQDSDLSRYLEPAQVKLLTSIATFQERIVREIMVPRIDVTALDKTATIKEAAQAFITERYSRVPVYSGTVDQVTGVLLYKDILELYIKHAENGSVDFLNQSIENLVKPTLFAPETKKISKLLQEFRKAQNHLAIIVDEYGGTEGIVSIEDILEELVGEIEDEYDTDDELLYKQHDDGKIVVDAKMSIIDIEKELGIAIPDSPEYDTIGGYIFHRAGSIPAKGWRIHHESFDLEVLSSSPRAINKIRIIPVEK
ncbi:MAG: HlyC/CorC family transporter [Chlamydiales bacterium]|nr:HlyC/CorC family transporter [Chlamydiales bacterium]